MTEVEPAPDGEPRLTPQQKRVVAVLAGLTGLLLVALLVALAVRDDPDESVVVDATTTTTSSTVPEETTTTVDLPSSTTVAPTTTAKPSSTTTSAPPPPKPVIDGRGAVLTAPPSTMRREMAGNDCATLAEDGWTPECGLFTGKGSTAMAWLVEERAGAYRASVLRRGQGRQWTVVLHARDDDGSRFADVNVRVADVSGDGPAEAVFGFRRKGFDNVLSVDVVEGPGSVVVHRDSIKGSARVTTGQLDLWEASGSQYDHLTIRVADGAWRIVANVKVSPAEVPPSQL